MRIKNLFYLFIVSLSFVAISCSTQQGAALEGLEQTVQDKRLESQANYSLADVLRKNTALTVMGIGNNVKVLVRGTSTFGQHGQVTQPLYVVDGVAVGNNYATVDRRINVADIAKVEVLRSLSQVATYGERGNHGVIKITTKTGRRINKT